MRTVSAKTFLDELARCVVCGREHKPSKPSKTGALISWAGADGHSYRTRMFELFGHSSVGEIAKLRALADSMKAAP